VSSDVIVLRLHELIWAVQKALGDANWEHEQ
jgi:hypothetical protein